MQEEILKLYEKIQDQLSQEEFLAEIAIEVAFSFISLDKFTKTIGSQRA